MTTDQQLRNYIDQIFLRYDRDNSGTLEPNELGGFFNDIFAMMGDPRRVNQLQAMQALQSIDKNCDGRASKMELFMAFKSLMGTQQQQYGQQQGYGNQGYGNQGYGNQGYGNQGPYQKY